METGALLTDFVQQLRCENTDIPDIYFSLLGAAGISPSLVLKKMPKPKRKEAESLSAAKIGHSWKFSQSASFSFQN